MRGGFGVYTSPFVFSNGITQPGFSQSTPFTATQNIGLTFQSTLANPYPVGVLQPAGNSLGPNTFLGQSLNRFMPLDGMQASQLSRYLVNLQRQLPGQWLLEAAYVGSHGFHLTTNEELNAIPAQYLSSSRVRDQAIAVDLEAYRLVGRLTAVEHAVHLLAPLLLLPPHVQAAALAQVVETLRQELERSAAAEAWIAGLQQRLRVLLEAVRQPRHVGRN